MNKDTPSPMDNPTPEYRARVAQLNDQLRSTMEKQYGRVMMTTFVVGMKPELREELMRRVRAHSVFNQDNDPHGEHDFGVINMASNSVEVNDLNNTEVYNWKIDYYDDRYSMHSPDPSDPTVTNRVLTVMHASDY